ncbi:phosphoribosylglycinamide formyltransferase [Vibrio sp. SS-MA-C1-2]|uniref:phosphoribosylglycinamide formyltransferase n=1 Tax=Vibrio sp. SS-MA-C1-2 TaxID=2908646 RepID=UPI001F1DE5FD|nr:phosphoribosylglycinamide formyltransferase [Vibrio sp. SS-MA-C1-2]UJF17843.1 phosphoribosylglycinamide formyltransferase [Vibrio sp. SS-MA-C1-2]
MKLPLKRSAILLMIISQSPVFANSALTTVRYSAPIVQVANSQLHRDPLEELNEIASFDTNPTQPFNHFDDLYQLAIPAQQELETLCNLISAQNSAKPYYSGVKSIARAEKKIAHELNGQPELLTDVARATIVTDNIAQLTQVYNQLAQHSEVVRVKNRFLEPAPSGYRDISLLIILPETKMVTEVQLHLAEIAEIKNGSEHQLYQQVQKIQHVAVQQQRDLTDLEHSKIARIRVETNRLYDEAWSKHTPIKDVA